MMELFDEENAYTALADQWENYGTLNYIEDERRESLADSEVERSELLRQIFTMIRKTLKNRKLTFSVPTMAYRPKGFP